MSFGIPDAVCFILPSVVMVFLPQSKKLWLLSGIRPKGEGLRFHARFLISESNIMTASIRR